MKYLLRNFYVPVQEKYQKKLLHKTVFVKIFKFIKKKHVVIFVLNDTLKKGL